MSNVSTQTKELFASAAMLSETERGAWLDSACGDDAALRGEIESLLAAYDRAGDFLVERRPPATHIEEQIGPYRLIEKLGEGGMGEVYVAEQSRPLRRHVALKIVKRGMDSREVLARFDAERQALALMDHPHIARVLDGGMTESGRPFFVMELVNGEPVTVQADAARLPIRERLRLFVQICRALQHAHQRGIIHRDLKPSNVLVAQVDGTTVPKVIDFGVAKALNQQLSEDLLYTRAAQMIGTPLYMSPEQASLGSIDVDTRSDIYSLGVLLYELLVGTTPFDRDLLKRAGFDEMRRIIRDEEPPRPSGRLQALDPIDADNHADSRAIDRRRHQQVLKGELDWIVIRALDKDRNRRYQTAAEFADDVERYLNGLPVSANPPSAVYRAQKFARRHLGSLLAALLVLAALVAGTGVSIWQWRHALTEAKRADVEAASALHQMERARKKAADALVMKRLADEKTAEAERESRRTSRQYYLAQMNLAQRDWEANEISSLRDRLSRTRPRQAGDADPRGFEWYYWHRLSAINVIALPFSTTYSRRTTFSPDGRQVAISSYHSTIHLMDAVTGQERHKLSAHPVDLHYYGAPAFSPDGRSFVCGNSTGFATVWDTETGKERLTLRMRYNSIRNIAFSPDGNRIVIGKSEGDARVWDATTGKELIALDGNRDRSVDPVACNSVAFSPDGRRVAIGTREVAAKVWDFATGKVTSTLVGQRQLSSPIAFSPDGRQIVRGCHDGAVAVWDVETRQQSMTFKGHSRTVNIAFFSPDGRRIISGSDDGTVKVWDAATGLQTVTIADVKQTVTAVSSRPDVWRIVSVSPAGQTTILSLPVRQTRLAHHGRVSSVAFSPDGRRIAGGCGDKRVKVWDMATMQESLSLEGHTGAVASVAFSPDGRRIVSGSYDKSVKVWDAVTGQDIRTLKSHSGIINSVACSPNGEWIVSGSDDSTAIVWDAATGEQQLTLTGHSAQVSSVAISPDGERIASGSWDKAVKVWDVATGRLTRTLTGHTEGVTGVAFSPDGRWIVSGSWDRSAKVWDAANGKQRLTLKGHDEISSVAFSPDGGRIVSGNRRQKVKVWDAETGHEILTFKVQSGSRNGNSFSTRSVVFSPDGRWIASGNDDETVSLWDSGPRDTDD